MRWASAFFRQMIAAPGRRSPRIPERPPGAVNAAADERTNTLVVTASRQSSNSSIKFSKCSIQIRRPSPRSRSFSLNSPTPPRRRWETDHHRLHRRPRPGPAATTKRRPPPHAAAGRTSQTVRGGHAERRRRRSNQYSRCHGYHSEAMRIITGILAQLDANPAAESSFFIYHLRNGVATDVSTTLNTLFGTSTTNAQQRQQQRQYI